MSCGAREALHHYCNHDIKNCQAELSFEDELHSAYSLLQCSTVIYNSKASIISQLMIWGYSIFEVFADNELHNDTQMFMACNDDNIIICFRGTTFTDIDDWATNFQICLEADVIGGKVHKGFYEALNDKSFPEDQRPINRIRSFIYDHRFNKKKGCQKNIYITGHSLGGALSMISAALIMEQNGDVDDMKHMLDTGTKRDDEITIYKTHITGIYTFGQPNVGDNVFMEGLIQLFKMNDIEFFRMVNKNDIVPRSPPELGLFDYGEEYPCYYCDKDNNLRQVKECPDMFSERCGYMQRAWQRLKIIFGWNSTWRERLMNLLLPGILLDHIAASYLRAIKYNL